MSENTVVAPVVVVAREIQKVAELGVAAMPTYKIRKTNSNTFRCLTLAENEKANWKKGLVYLINRYSKGVNFEMWMYSTKKGAHLAQFNDRVRPLAVGEIKCESLGHALKLRLSLLDTLTDEQCSEKIKAFMEAVEPTLEAIRAEIKVDVSEKETKSEATAAEPTSTDVPAAPAAETAAEAPMSKRQAKKAAKRAAKAA